MCNRNASARGGGRRFFGPFCRLQHRLGGRRPAGGVECQLNEDGSANATQSGEEKPERRTALLASDFGERFSFYGRRLCPILQSNKPHSRRLLNI